MEDKSEDELRKYVRQFLDEFKALIYDRTAITVL